MEKIIAIATTLAFLSIATGQLPKIIYALHIAQAKLIQDSKASKWGRAPLLDDNFSSHHQTKKSKSSRKISSLRKQLFKDNK